MVGKRAPSQINQRILWKAFWMTFARGNFARENAAKSESRLCGRLFDCRSILNLQNLFKIMGLRNWEINERALRKPWPHWKRSTSLTRGTNVVWMAVPSAGPEARIITVTSCPVLTGPTRCAWLWSLVFARSCDNIPSTAFPDSLSIAWSRCGPWSANLCCYCLRPCSPDECRYDVSLIANHWLRPLLWSIVHRSPPKTDCIISHQIRTTDDNKWALITTNAFSGHYQWSFDPLVTWLWWLTILQIHLGPHEQGRIVKSHKIRSVASRSRRFMIIIDQLFIRQLELN
jgi:hypothetical protein